MPTRLGDSSRHFFEAVALPELKKSKVHVKQLEGLSDVCSTCDGDLIWTMTFSYRGHHFLIDTNYHAALSNFFAADPECPDDILIEILLHFRKLSRLRCYEEQSLVRNMTDVMLLLVFIACLVLAAVFAAFFLP